MPLRILAAALSGLLLSVAFEPVAFFWVAPLAIAGLVLTTRGLRVRAALVPGLAFGVGFYFSLAFWMRTVGPDAWVAMSAFMSLFYVLAGGLFAVLQRLPGWPVWCAAAWTMLEVLRSGWPFSGMPWGNLAFAVVDTPLTALLPYVGSVAVGFVVALAGTLLALLLGPGPGPGSQRPLDRSPVRSWWVRTAPLAVLVAVVAVATVLPWQARSDTTVPIAVVQGDVPGPRGDNILFDFRQVTANHVEATQELGRRVRSGETPEPALVLWPENSTAVDPFADSRTRSGIEAASASVGVPILVGAIVDGGPGHVLNQGIVWDPETGAGERYTKRHPVVFGEYIPFRDQLANLQIGRLTMVGRDMLSGTRREPLDIDGIAVADAICFDIAYDDVLQDQVLRGAELVTVQTSNATFVNTDQIDQQFAITRLRAIEAGRWVAVASTNGLTGVIDPSGRVVTQAQRRTTDVLSADVGLVSSITPAMRVGAWPGRLATLVTLLALAAALLPRRRVRAAPMTRETEQELSISPPTPVSGHR
ncbi:MAG: apolipoprotein N-acyltransferase [Nocardioides sp.]|nr:apolipoprotein N-acyltransferase [Nocardioides sp.]